MGPPGRRFQQDRSGAGKKIMEKEIQIEIEIGGERIAGTLHVPAVPGSKSCIITCHGLLASRLSPKAVMVGKLSERMGFYCLRFDFRGCGDSGGRFADSVSSRRLEDLDRVIEYVRKELGINDIGLFGSSLGGYVSLLRAGEKGKIKAVVSVSTPFSMAELLEDEIEEKGYCDIDGYRIGKNFLDDAREYDQKLREGLGGIKCPVLFVQGSADPLVPPSHASELYSNVVSTRELRIIEGADHSYSDPEHLFKLIELSLEWFRRHMFNARIQDPDRYIGSGKRTSKAKKN